MTPEPPPGGTPLDHALTLLAAGVSVVPIACDGTKRPCVASWKEYQSCRAGEGLARQWWAAPRGIAAVCGAVSGGLEMIDFDDAELYPEWAAVVEESCPGLLERLVVVRTPRPGVHVWFRCPGLQGGTPGNTKLARGQDGKTSVETRGEGGYALVPGGAAEAHETGRPYEYLAEGLDEVPAVAPEERECLMSAARYLDRSAPAHEATPRAAPGLDLRPGEDYERRASWEDLLGAHGWVIAGRHGEEVRWRRPGKRIGWSATTGRCRGADGADLLRVFSSNADPFREGRAYGLFRAFALLNTSGDFARAASLLSGQGYGAKARPGRKAAQPASSLPGQENGRAEEAAVWSVTLDGDVIAAGSPETVLEVAGVPDDGPVKRTRVFEMRTLGSILKAVFPAPRWLVSGIMSEGLNLLIGSPKQGKSIMALNLALTIAGGGKALQDVSVTQAAVLYLSLEDQLRRVQERAFKMLKSVPGEVAEAASPRLTVSVDWPRQDRGGLRLIDLWLKKTPDAGLVIIDVWNRFSPTRPAGGNAYEQDAQFLGEVQAFVTKRGLAALVVHHTRKSPAGMKDEDDFVASSSGTQGFTGSADGIMVLVRNRNETQAELKVTGRDVEERRLVLEFDKDALTWKSLGTATQHMTGKVQAAIITFLRERGSFGASCPEIAEGIEEKDNSVRQALSRMLTARAVMRRGNLWLWPGAPDGGGGA